MTIKNFVLTGGPCAGKTTAIHKIKEEYGKRGYTVLTMSETATDLINGGIAPWTCGTNCDFQSVILMLQLQKEDAYRYAASTMKAETIIIIYDRGAMDNRGYMNDEEYAKALQFANVTEDQLMARYDAVFHMETAAKSEDPDAYSTTNNTARYEKRDEAIKVDDNLLAAWSGHPHHCVIKSVPSIEEKVGTLIAKIGELLK